jgi:nickel-dependent lactate racemase
MQNSTSLRWAAWFGDRDLPLKLPSKWEVQTFKPKGGKDIGERGLREAIASLRLKPIESPTLKQLAQGKRDAVIVVDDLTRPMPGHRLLPLVIKELVAGGMEQDSIRIIMGVAAHHPMLREDIVKKETSPD